MTKKQTITEQAPWRQQVRQKVEPNLEAVAAALRSAGCSVSLVAEEPETSHLGWRLRVYPPSDDT